MPHLDKLQIRQARPADASAVIDLIYSSGPRAFDYGFSCPGHPARAFLRSCFESHGGLFSWDCHAVVTCDEEILAVGSFYTDREYPRLNRGLIRQVLGFFPLRHLPAVIRRSMQLARLLPPPGRHQLYMANLGVAPQWRGQGIGERLIRHHQRQAKNSGLQACALDVAVDNPRAEALYRRLGFRLVRERTFSGPTGKVADALRMELPLQAV